MRRHRESISAKKINKEIANYTKVLAIFTAVLAIATIELTYITYEDTRYKSPDVSLIGGYIAKLYILQDNNSETTYFTLLGISSVYNSASSSDIALLRQKNIGKSFYVSKNNKNDTISIEGSSFPIPIAPRESKDFPLLITYKNKRIIEKNVTGELEIDEEISKIEVLHPTSRAILNNLTSLKPANITYTMGKETAILKLNDGSIYDIDVRYTEDKETYHEWKIIFLRPYGISSLIT